MTLSKTMMDPAMSIMAWKRIGTRTTVDLVRKREIVCLCISFRIYTYAFPGKGKKRHRKTDAKGKPEPKKRVATTVFSKPNAKAAAAAPPRPTAQDINPYKKQVDVGQEADFMSSLLGGLESTPNVESTTSTSFLSSSTTRKRKSSPEPHFSHSNGNSLRASTSSSFRKPRFSNALTPTGTSSPDPYQDLLNNPSSDGSDLPSSKKLRREDDSSVNGMDALDFGNDSFDVDMGDINPIKNEEEEDIFVKPAPAARLAAAPRRALVNSSSVKAKPLLAEKAEEKADVSKDNKKVKGVDWRVATAELAVADAEMAEDEPLPAIGTKAKGKKAEGPVTSKIKAFESDGESLRFYWLDHMEVNGVVHLTGKVLDKETGKYVSCCLSVEGIERNLFVLPRGKKSEEAKLANASQKKEVPLKKAKKQMDSDEEDEESSDSGSDEKEAEESEDDESDYGPTLDDVYDDFDEVRQEAGITSWASKEVTRKYAFELPGVPAETRYLKVVYGFDRAFLVAVTAGLIDDHHYAEPQLPMDLTGRTFKRVFGTNTSAFELFIIKRKIMGPCWLDVKNAELSGKGVGFHLLIGIILTALLRSPGAR